MVELTNEQIIIFIRTVINFMELEHSFCKPYESETCWEHAIESAKMRLGIFR